MNVSIGKVGTGRKRSEDSRRAILDAAVEIISEHGYAGLSMERIARESGTGKQTIYRWWPTKADVVMEALINTLELMIPVSQTGDFRHDLAGFLRDTVALGRRPQIAELLRALAAEAQLDADFAERFRGVFIAHRRTALSTILEQHGGVAAGAVRTSTLLDVVFGVVWYRLLIVPAEFDDQLVGELVTLIAGPEHDSREPPT